MERTEEQIKAINKAIQNISEKDWDNLWKNHSLLSEIIKKLKDKENLMIEFRVEILKHFWDKLNKEIQDELILAEL